ncbi:MAG: DNA-directed RNA polymerase subunit beta', partial [Pseudomonadota bacterium]
SKINILRTAVDYDGEIREKLVKTTPGRLMVANLLPKDYYIRFDMVNKPLTKKQVLELIDIVYRNCGQKKTVIFADQLMNFGFSMACRSGVSFGKDDMVVPKTKQIHIDKTAQETKSYERQYADGLITSGEKYNKVVDAWSRCTDIVAHDMMAEISAGFVDDDNKVGQEKVNSIYMMAHSKARGSAAQIKQLAGMRGLIAKPSGEIIERPIISNFKEGLSVHEYFNSSHGARKGLADTALKTANSGYLTRRLVDVSQDCTVTQEDCGTRNGLVMKAVMNGAEVEVPLAEKILGRVSLHDVFHPTSGTLIIGSGELITEDITDKIDEAGIEEIMVRSVLTCESANGVCAKCYGRDLAVGGLVSVGEAVGVIAAQSIGEPGTQLTMRTFHIGGAATRRVEISHIEASFDTTIKILNRNVVTNSSGQKIVMSRNCELLLIDTQGNERSRNKVQYGSILMADDNEAVTKGQKLAEWDPYNIPIIIERSGSAMYTDLVDGVSFNEILDEETGIANKVIVDWNQQKRGNDLRPRITLVDENKQVLLLANSLEARYFLPVGAVLAVNDGDQLNEGDVIARIPRESSKTRDITGGLPRVAELFEARKPKDHSIISEVEGTVEFGKDYKSKRRIIIHPADGSEPVEYLVPRGKHITVNEGDYVGVGDLLMDGNPVPHDILKVLGVEALANYMVTEVQQVYRLQGVKIDDKHIEVVLRQMLQKVEIRDPGQTTFLHGEQVDREELERENQKALEKNYRLATAVPVLQGITKASLQTRSYISAASFQETTRVLTEAAVAGKIDNLQGLKENVIVGRLIPAGTGYHTKEVVKQASERDLAIIREQQQQLTEGFADAEMPADTSITPDATADQNGDNGGNSDDASGGDVAVGE